jgi:hypothetical protein
LPGDGVGKKNWADTDDAVAMYAHLGRHTGGLADRKFRFLFVGVLRSKWEEHLTAAGHRALQAIESFADGGPTRARAKEAFVKPNGSHIVSYVLETALADDPWMLRKPNTLWLLSRHDPVGAAVLRDVFRHPCHCAGFNTAWRSPDAVGLARAIYDDRAFDRLPILADALLDAGCDDEDILNHCRSSGPHVRGCWVVDLVLGKE